MAMLPQLTQRVLSVAPEHALAGQLWQLALDPLPWLAMFALATGAWLIISALDRLYLWTLWRGDRDRIPCTDDASVS
jgi:hypothetical protein